MKKSIIVSLSIIVMCLTMIIGVSYAAFTSSSGFNGNSITTSSVDVDAELYFEGTEVDNISISNMSPGQTKMYRLSLYNNSTTTIAYRTIFNVSGSDEIFNYLNITVGDEDVLFNSYRGTSTWVRNINSGYIQTFITISLEESMPEESEGQLLNFDFSVEAIYDNFVSVSSQDDANKLVNNEFAMLTSNVDELVLNKNVYLDLNGFEINNLTLEGDNVTFVELTNGTINNLVANTVNATIYANVDITNEATLNISMNSFYLKNELESNVVINIVSGKVVLETSSLLEVNILEGNDEVVLVTSENTIIEKLEVSDESNQSIKVLNKGEVKEVVLNTSNQNFEIENNTSLFENENLSYVTVDGNGTFISTENGVSYMNNAITLTDFLNNPTGVFYFEEGTYYLSETLLLERDVFIYGLGNVVFEKEYENSYSNNTLVEVYKTALFSNIVFNDHINSNISSTCITSVGNLTVENCEFNDFAKNSIRLNGGEATIFNNLFYYLTKTGSAGNGVVVAGSATATIENNTFDSFEQGSDTWAATSILVYDGGYAYINNNTFNNCKYAIVLTYMYTDEVGSFVEENNIFNNVTYNVCIQDDGYYIVSEEATRSSYVYTDEETLYRYVYFGTKYSNIQEAINDASDYSTIYVYEGVYNVETKINNVDSNLHINKPLNLIAVGEVELVTTLPGNSNGISQQTVYICASDVLFDGFTVNVTTQNPNKAFEIVSGSNITVSNNVINGGSLYIGGGLVGDYYILNNTINNQIAITITNGAGNASTKTSLVDGNITTGALFLTGTRTNGWDLLDLDIIPTITNNTFGYYNQEINGVGYNYYIRFATTDIEKLPTIDLAISIGKLNTFTNLESASYTTITTPGTGNYEGLNTYYGFYGSTYLVETE